jgi:hypothetical protein
MIMTKRKMMMVVATNISKVLRYNRKDNCYVIKTTHDQESNLMIVTVAN